MTSLNNSSVIRKNTRLPFNWEVYYRDPISKDFSINSYNKILEISNIGELRAFLQLISDDKLKKGHISIMKKNILPIYEDKQNENGGAWTLKVKEDDVPFYSKHYITHMLTDTLIKKHRPDNDITGIKICPRRGFSIIQIWTKAMNYNYEDISHGENITPSSFFFRKHSV